jgi:quinol monooxygenase YgiN
LFAIVSCVTTIDEGADKAELLQFEVTSLHLYDSTLNVSEVEMAKVLNEINDVIAEIGYPGAGYSLWKVQDDSIMQYRFMMLSSWPDKADYDSIHNSEAFNSVIEKYTEFFEPVREQSIYHRYDLVK